jgi:hypothetical protein
MLTDETYIKIAMFGKPNDLGKIFNYPQKLYVQNIGN